MLCKAGSRDKWARYKPQTNANQDELNDATKQDWRWFVTLTLVMADVSRPAMKRPPWHAALFLISYYIYDIMISITSGHPAVVELPSNAKCHFESTCSTRSPGPFQNATETSPTRCPTRQNRKTTAGFKGTDLLCTLQATWQCTWRAHL